MYIGGDEQLINALRHMADKRPITRAEKDIVQEAAFRLAVYVKAESEGASPEQSPHADT